MKMNWLYQIFLVFFAWVIMLMPAPANADRVVGEIVPVCGTEYLLFILIGAMLIGFGVLRGRKAKQFTKSVILLMVLGGIFLSSPIIARFYRAFYYPCCPPRSNNPCIKPKCMDCFYKEKAEKGDQYAQQAYGAQCLGFGKVDDGLALMRKAVEQGGFQATYTAFNLGLYYSKGLYVRQDWAEAYFWFSLAALDSRVLGNSFYPVPRVRQRNLAEQNLTPEQIAAAKARIAEWLRAHPKTFPPPYDTKGPFERHNLALFYLENNQNLDFARQLLLSDAERGYPSTQEELGKCYSTGACGVSKSYSEAYFWFSLYTVRVDWRVKDRDAMAAHLSPEEKEAVDKRVKEWKPIAAPIPDISVPP